MNLAVHRREANIRHGGQVYGYYNDPHDATGRFDFVLAKGSMWSNQSGECEIRKANIEVGLVGCMVAFSS